MTTTPTFVEHALDLLSLVEDVEARRMFGGHGLYHGGVMFGLLDDDELFLKTDEETRARFVEAGCKRWVYAAMQETSYFRPPDDAHEDPEAMLPWARLAVDAALRRQAAKDAEAAAKAARRAARERPAAKKPSRAKVGKEARRSASGPARSVEKAPSAAAKRPSRPAAGKSPRERGRSARPAVEKASSAVAKRPSTPPARKQDRRSTSEVTGKSPRGRGAPTRPAVEKAPKASPRGRGGRKAR